MPVGKLQKSICSWRCLPSLTGTLSWYINFVRAKLFTAIFQKIGLINTKAYDFYDANGASLRVAHCVAHTRTPMLSGPGSPAIKKKGEKHLFLPENKIAYCVNVIKHAFLGLLRPNYNHNEFSNAYPCCLGLVLVGKSKGLQWSKGGSLPMAGWIGRRANKNLH